MVILAFTLILTALPGILVFECSPVPGGLVILCALLIIAEQIFLRRRLKRPIHLTVNGILAVLCFIGLFFMDANETGDTLETYNKMARDAEEKIEEGAQEQATKILAGMEETYGIDDRIRILQATMYLEEKDADAAWECLEACEDTSSEEYYIQMEKLCRMSDGEDRAENLYELYVNAARDLPFSEYAQRMAGISRFEQHNLVSAEYYLLRAYKLDPEIPETLYYLGAVKFRQFDYETGENYFSEAVEKGADEEIQSYILWYLEHKDTEIIGEQKGGEEE